MLSYKLNNKGNLINNLQEIEEIINKLKKKVSWLEKRLDEKEQKLSNLLEAIRFSESHKFEDRNLMYSINNANINSGLKLITNVDNNINHKNNEYLKVINGRSSLNLFSNGKISINCDELTINSNHSTKIKSKIIELN